jgi:hypothetical protein
VIAQRSLEEGDHIPVEPLVEGDTQKDEISGHGFD